MKSTGVVRKLDELGRITLPKEIRKVNGWEEKQPLEIFTDGNKVVLSAYEASEDKKQVLEDLNYLLGAADNPEAKQKLRSVLTYLRG
ncbi:AbrB/MazE/SpoVT family DNA-binding domain-containing protein [Sediminibacillus terrae]|uniref:AbrB/MazE/SpoVT family DNA-binding domain-containing protein n=1 Tax=Sediminibacillus terrae TaxID=1562106 RepID=UPI00129580C9|nr:AbrB/MazE/SpoVT family DNA-binding domain-containing protein [Sediminibacillus terrae]